MKISEQRIAINGEHGSLRAWLDGSRHRATNEPTFCVDVVYLDQSSRKTERARQRGLRASTVANICACVCFGEENLTPVVVEKINQRFEINR